MLFRDELGITQQSLAGRRVPGCCKGPIHVISGEIFVSPALLQLRAYIVVKHLSLENDAIGSR